jgi:nicotinamide mononucleotide (NMN) deamidase PncC
LKLELGSTYALSETGWAGPAPEGTSVGTAFFGIAAPRVEKSTSIETNSSNRSDNMASFARLALEYFLEFLKALPAV